MSETYLLVLLYPRAQVTVSSPHLWILHRVLIVVVSPHLVTVLYQSGFPDTHTNVSIQLWGVQHLYCRLEVLTNTFCGLTVCMVDFNPFCQNCLPFRIFLCNSPFFFPVREVATAFNIPFSFVSSLYVTVLRSYCFPV